MRVVVLGSGGREHALAYKISQSPALTKLYCIPGNPGTESFAENVLLDINDHNLLKDFCLSNNIDLVMVGPEQPLVDGIADHLREKDIKVFGPSAEAAQLESSKSFAKTIMMRAKVPTAAYREFESHQKDETLRFLEASKFPIVVKADGLAAGKGVLICNSFEEAVSAVTEIFVDKVFGSAGNKLIIEEFLTGEEASVFAITDGKNFICLPPAQDHKRIGNNDTGKNTGGMGAYSPAPIVTEELMKIIQQKIIEPVIRQMEKENTPFVGCLYAGLMITSDGPKVIEFNCRFGDPETQVVLPLLGGDLLELLYSSASGNLKTDSVYYNGGCSVCVVAVSGGYPDNYKKGFPIEGIEQTDPGIIVYHAGTKKMNDNIVTNGGRVLGITSILDKNDLKSAKAKAYSYLKNIKFEGIYFRTDIADKALK